MQETINQHISEAYDSTPYLSSAFDYLAPGNLRAVAHLYGVDSVPLERARVLELGCAAGGNLLPFAVAYPEARVTGIDISPVQVKAGCEFVEKLGITNLRLEALSITDIGPEFGQFDYIICHGVFSWVPSEVQQAILRIFQENLSENGLACISYNTYPGWKTSDIIRDAMLLNSHASTSVEQRENSATEILQFLQTSVAPSNPMRSALVRAANTLQRYPTSYILHEYLETFNTPCYFLEFYAALHERGLGYVSDAQSTVDLAHAYGENVEAGLSRLPGTSDRAVYLQFLDFASGQSFRKSIVTRAGKMQQEHVRPLKQAYETLYYAIQLDEVSVAKDDPPGRRRYTQNGTPVALEVPIVIAIADSLRRVWPDSMHFDELTESVSKNLRQPFDDVADLLPGALELLGFQARLNLRREPSVYDRKKASAPRLIPGAALLLGARKEGQQIALFNLWHASQNVPETDLVRFMVSLLDGQRTVTELSKALRGALSDGKVKLPDGTSLAGQRNLDRKAREFTEATLSLLNHAGLIAGTNSSGL